MTGPSLRRCLRPVLGMTRRGTAPCTILRSAGRISGSLRLACRQFDDGCLVDGRQGVRQGQTPTSQIPLPKSSAQRGGHVMCDRIGCTHFPKLSEMDFSGAATPSRRRFLKGAAAVSTISMGHACAGTAHAGAPVKSTHGSGFCNLNIFLAHSRQYAKARRHRAGVHQHADLGRDGDLPRHGPGRYRPDALHQLHGALRQGRAGQDRGRRRRRGLRHRRPSRPRFAREAQGQDARHLPDGYAGGHALRLPEEAQDLLQGRQGPLHGQHARGRRGLQGGRHRLDLHHRALRLGPGGRRQGRGHADRRHRPLRQGLHRLRAGRARQPDQGQSRRG